MKKTLKGLFPIFLILFGLFLLLLMNLEKPAGVCFLIGIVMLIEKIWPEKWESEKLKKE